MSSLKEAFSNPSTAQSDFYSEQQIRFHEVEPNRFLPDKIKGSLGNIITDDTRKQFSSYDPYTGSVTNKFTAAGISKILQGQASTTDEEAYCRTFIGPASLPTLIADQDLEKNIPIRCGWRYKKSPGGGMPLVSQGALGTINGPLNAKEDPLGDGVEWIWNLRKAQERHAKDYRQALPATAEGLTAARASFPNSAWCSQTNTFISVDQAGNPLPGYTCSKTNVVTNPTQFPAIRQSVAANLASQNAVALTDCMKPGQNPSLARDCLLQAVRTQGCSTDGTLYQAIEATKANAPSYDAFLQKQPSFQTYQSKQGSNKITEELFNKERGSWDMAVREIQKVQRATQSSQDPLVRVAAQDLCYAAGKFDEYDFCSDIPASAAIGSVDLKCIQNYWQQQNGKPAGILYPTQLPLPSQLGAIRTWGEYQNAVNQLKAGTNSTNPIEQRTALNNFLGVSVTTVAFSPLNLDNLAQNQNLTQPLLCWLDAKDGESLTIDGGNRVRDWSDKSGKQNTVIQASILNRPIYKREAFPGVEFNGSNQFLPFLNPSSLVPGNFCIFVVEKRKSSKDSNFFLGGTQTLPNSNLTLGYRTNTSITMSFGNNDININVPPFANTVEPTRIWCFEKTSMGRSIYLNGTRIGGDNNGQNLFRWDGAALGRSLNGFYGGTLYEVLLYNTDLSMDRRQKLEGYLADKWGVSDSLPSGHPFKMNPP